MPNPLSKYFKGISYPQRTLDSVFSTVLELKETVEMLGGLRKGEVGRAALYEELSALDRDGPPGPTGATGATGPAGPTGPTGPAPTLATTTETLTGTDTAKAVTPDALAALWEKGSNVASGTTVSFGEGGFFHVTGSNTISDVDFSPQKDGRWAWVYFDASLALTHSVNLKLPGNASRGVQAGDRALFVQDVSETVTCLVYVKADGTAMIHQTAAQTSFTPVGDIAATDVQAAIAELATEPKGWRNRIINGDFAIDQRNNGALVTASASSVYPVDRWAITSGQAPGTVTGQRIADTTNLGEYYLEVKSGVADASLAAGDYYQIYHRIEGFNVRDFLWGSAQAKAITISFWVKGNAAYTLPLAVQNASLARTWLGSFAVTTGWTKVTLSVSGDVTGTWEKTNLTGIDIHIALAAGSTLQGVAGWQAGNKLGLAGMSNFMAAGANSLQIKDFQLEVGSVATEFERVDYSEQLARCQRYYEVMASGTGVGWSGITVSGNTYSAWGYFVVAKRAAPTLTLTNINNSGFAATPGSSQTQLHGYIESRVSNAGTNNSFFHSSAILSAEL